MRILYLLCLSFCTMAANSQLNKKQSAGCATRIDWQKLESDPVAFKAFSDQQAVIKEYLKNSGRQQQEEIIYEIPVVFHIVLDNPCMVTNEIINKQLEILNEAFDGTNTDKDLYAKNFKADFANNTNIKFVLAKRTPEGFYTSGITRTSSDFKYDGNLLSRENIKFTSKKGHNKWQSPSCKYLNIWVGENTGGAKGVIGYATLPYGYSNGAIDLTYQVQDNIQGVVIDYRTMQGFNDFDKTKSGKTLVHEIGHYFGLIHIWGDDEELADLCSYDDYIDDTPKQGESTSTDLDVSLGVIIADLQNCSPPNPGVNYQNYMDYSPDIYRCMFTKDQAEYMKAYINYSTRKDLVAPENQALVPSLEKYNLFNTCNTPAFTTNNFRTIGVGKHGVVWAATAGQGLYQYNKGEWRKWDIAPFNTVNFQDIKADQDGEMWVAQSGTSGSQSISGSIINFTDTTLTDYQVYNPTNNGLPTRNVRSLFIDTSRYNNAELNPLVWSAHYATTSTAVSGALGRGVNPSFPNFTAIRTGMEVANNTGGIFYLGGDSKEIWSFATNNFGKSQVLRHDAVTNQFIEALDASNAFSGIAPDQFQARSIYFDANGNKWIGINGVGLVVIQGNNIYTVSFPELFTASPLFNTNAITGDASGNVYIGCSNGLICYRSGENLNALSSYTRYSTDDVLPSNFVNGLSVDTMRNKLLVATGNGIAFLDLVCPKASQITGNVFSTITNGDWGVAGNWCTGQVPTENDEVIIRHPITITSDIKVKSMRVYAPGSVSVAPGIKIDVKIQ